jgi:hypothetical protein
VSDEKRDPLGWHVVPGTLLLIEKLNEALACVVDPQKLVGKTVPRAAEEWGELNGLDVARSDFAPPGYLYIIGAVPVPWDAAPEEAE